MAEEGEEPTKFFLTMDADGVPLPVYEHPSDIGREYLDVYNTIISVERKTEKLLDWDDRKTNLRDDVLLRICTD